MYCLGNLARVKTSLHTCAAFVLVQVRLIVWIGHFGFISMGELLFRVVGHDMDAGGAVRADRFCSVNYCLRLWSHQLQFGNARGSVLPFEKEAILLN